MAWQGYQKLRAIHHQLTRSPGELMVAAVIDSLHTCPLPGVVRLGRILRCWRAEIVTYFDTAVASNGPTEAINGGTGAVRRVARGFRNPENYRLRALISTGGHRPWRTT